MKGSKRLLIWIVVLAVLVAASYIFYSKYKPGAFGLSVQPGISNETVNNPEINSQNNSENSKLTDVNNDGASAAVNNDDTPESESEQADKIMAPDFELKDLDGNTTRLSDYRGKIVILNFWAVWCKYCVLEMPDFNEVDKKLKEAGDAVILAVNVEEPENKVRDFVESNKIGMKILMDEDGTVASMYGLQGYPTTFILNTDGSLYAYIPGATNKETIEMLIEKVRNGEPLN